MPDWKVLKKTKRPAQTQDGNWEILIKTELEVLVPSNIIGETKLYRLRWLGYLERTRDAWRVKRVYLRRSTKTTW